MRQRDIPTVPMLGIVGILYMGDGHWANLTKVVRLMGENKEK